MEFFFRVSIRRPVKKRKKNICSKLLFSLVVFFFRYKLFANINSAKGCWCWVLNRAGRWLNSRAQKKGVWSKTCITKESFLETEPMNIQSVNKMWATTSGAYSTHQNKLQKVFIYINKYPHSLRCLSVYIF